MSGKIGVCIAVAWMFSACVARGQMIDNGTFDADIDGWSASGYQWSAVWDQLDADSDPASGSALVTNLSDTARDASGSGQCVADIEPGALYRVKSDILFPGGQTDSGYGAVLVRWYSDFCLGSQISPYGETGVVLSSNRDQWISGAGVFVAPPGAVEAHVRLSVWKEQAGGSLAAHFDNVVMENIEPTFTFIPAAGYAHGDAGSFWKTDLEVHNTGPGVAAFQLWWLAREEDNSSPLVSGWTFLDPGESRRYENVLDSVFNLSWGDSPYGAIAVVSDQVAVLAMARIYNDPGGNLGTFGQAVPAVTLKEMIGTGERRRILLMTEDSDFRGNVGCQNGTTQPLTVSLALLDETGEALDVKSLSLPPMSNGQINRIFRDFEPVRGHVVVWSDTPDARFFCYGSVIDLHSNDPTTVMPR